MLTVEWCSICSEAPANGRLTIIIDGDYVDIPACNRCVNDPERVEFID